MDLRTHLDEGSTAAEPGLMWPNAELNRWLNDGMRDIARNTETIQDTWTLDTVANQQVYPAPTDAIRIYRIEYSQSASQVNEVEYKPYRSMDKYWFQSKNVSGSTPRYWTTHGFPGTIASGRSVSDANMTSGSAVITSPRANFNKYTDAQRVLTTDCTTTNASAILTSAAGNFNPDTDNGKTVTGAGIPASTTILQVQSFTQATMSNNATATASNVTVTIAGVAMAVTGAGAASANLSTTILSVQSPTQATLAANASTTVTLQTATIGDPTRGLDALPIRLYPIPSSSLNQALKFYYYRLPHQLVNDTDQCELPAGWEDAVVLYAERNALRKDSNPRFQEASDLYAQRLQELIAISRLWSDQGTEMDAAEGQYEDLYGGW